MENTMEMNDAVKGKIEDYVKNNKVVLFLKGTPQQPMCGFSAKTVAALDSVVPTYVAVNVLDDSEIREGIKVYGNWPTIPQLYIDGELVGGCDIILNMLNSGELHQSLGLEQPDRSAPEITTVSNPNRNPPIVATTLIRITNPMFVVSFFSDTVSTSVCGKKNSKNRDTARVSLLEITNFRCTG